MRLRLQLAGRRLGGGNGRSCRLLGLRDQGGRFGFALPLRLVHELLREQERALQSLVGQRGRVGCGGRLDRRR